MGMLSVHFNNHYTRDHEQLRKPDIRLFLQQLSIEYSEKGKNQSKKKVSLKLSRCLPAILLKKVFIVHVLLGINLIFCKNYFHHHLPRAYLRLLQTSKIEKFAIIVGDFNSFMRRPQPYRNQSIDLQSKLMDWFLYDNGLRHERVKNR